MTEELLPQITLTGSGADLDPAQVLAHALRQYQAGVRAEAEKRVLEAPMALGADVLAGILMEVASGHLNLFRITAGVALRVRIKQAARRQLLSLSEMEAAQQADDAAMNLGAYLAATSSNAVMDGYHLNLNLKVPAKEAARRSVRAFGLTVPQMRTVFRLRDEGVSSSEPGAWKSRIEAFIERAFGLRLHTLVDNTLRQVEADTIQRGWEQGLANGTIPVTATKVWITALDERTCPVCAPMDRVSVPITDSFRLPDGNRVKSPPVHVNCILGDSVVSTDAGHTAMKRWYVGPMIEVRTERGHVLTGTPHHPVLTERGWVALGHLHEGAHLVSDVSGEWLAGRDPHEDRDKTLLADRFEALRVSEGVFSERVEVSPEDFYGDGTPGKVHIVGTYRALGYEPQGQQVGVERELVDAAVGASGLSGQCSSPQFIGGDLPTSHGGMRRGRSGRTLVGGLGSGEECVLFTDGANADTPGHQGSRDDIATHSVMLSESLDALAGLVVFDQVVEVRTFPFSGHVYDLTTNCGWFVANGIVTHNCRCTVELAYEGEEFGKAKDWDPQLHPRARNGEFGRKARPYKEPDAEAERVAERMLAEVRPGVENLGAFGLRPAGPTAGRRPQAAVGPGAAARVQAGGLQAATRPGVGGPSALERVRSHAVLAGQLVNLDRLNMAHQLAVAAVQADIEGRQPTELPPADLLVPLNRHLMAFAVAGDLDIDDLTQAAGHAQVVTPLRFVDRTNRAAVAHALNQAMLPLDGYLRYHGVEATMAEAEAARDPGIVEVAADLRRQMLSAPRPPKGQVIISVTPEDASEAWRAVLAPPGHGYHQRFLVEAFDETGITVAATQATAETVAALTNVDVGHPDLPRVVIAPHGAWRTESGYGATGVGVDGPDSVMVTGAYRWKRAGRTIVLTPDADAYQRANPGN